MVNDSKTSLNRPKRMTKSLIEKLRNPVTIEELNAPTDIPSLIESLFDIRWRRNHLDHVDPSLPKSEYDQKTEELRLWSQFYEEAEDKCRQELDGRLASGSVRDREIARQEFQRRKGNDIPLSQLTTEEIKEKIQSEELENLLIKYRAKVAVEKRKTGLDKREKTIRKAIQDDLTGVRYAQYLDSEGLVTLERWQNDKNNPCRKRHADAYNDPHWRKLIQSEKSRVAKRMN